MKQACSVSPIAQKQLVRNQLGPLKETKIDETPFLLSNAKRLTPQKTSRGYYVLDMKRPIRRSWPSEAVRCHGNHLGAQTISCDGC